MNAIRTEPPATVNRCRIDEVFAGPFIELIALAPRNPVVRGLILSQTRKLPGPECETYEQIKAWVEATCEKRLRPAHGTQAPSGDGITVKVTFSEIERGRAYYSVPRSGTDDYSVSEEELVGMVQAAIEDGGGLDTVVEQIATEIDENAWEHCEPSLEDYGEYSYDEHDCNDTTDGGVEFSRAQVRDRLLGFLRERHPELLEELA
jgi:hypothetical protein